MKFMLLVKASPESESGVMPTAEMMAEMGRFNEELEKAGVLLDLNGLQDSSKGARIHYSGQERTVTDGPFAEAKELIAGYWTINVASKQEAIDWALRVPFQEGEVEIRQVFELEDFPDVPEEVRRLGQRLQERAGAK